MSQRIGNANRYLKTLEASKMDGILIRSGGEISPGAGGGLPNTDISIEIKNLKILNEVNLILSGTSNLAMALQKVLELLESSQGMIRGAVTLLNESNEELYIEAAHGLSADSHRVRYRLGEGITGRVVESGKPIIIPRVSCEPLFLNRAAHRKGLNKNDLTFICVPIIINQRAIGALGVDLPFNKDLNYERVLEVLRVVASMMAQAIKVHTLIEDTTKKLIDENFNLREELTKRYDFSNIIGNSGPMRQVYEQVAQVAPSNTTVLIRGESGTGKELIAQSIHFNSPRAKGPLVNVNCAALPDTLIESELFGYEKGAFTGAQSRKKGRFELAEGGTIFLDEVGELNLSTQVKLLRILQEKELDRLGGTETIKVNVRVIAATNKDLEKSIAKGTFREDLYYRLNVFSIFVPPLRERKPDVMLLADHFLQKYSVEHSKNIKRISTPAIDMLMSYHWPGNVRELENTIERAILVCDSNVIHAHHLPPTLQTAESSGTIMSLSLAEAIDSYERDILIDTLKTTRGNRTKAARLLKTTERVISYKVKKYNIDCERFKN
jgi:Nif-specific regulatory protein